MATFAIRVRIAGFFALVRLEDLADVLDFFAVDFFELVDLELLDFAEPRFAVVRPREADDFFALPRADPLDFPRDDLPLLLLPPWALPVLFFLVRAFAMKPPKGEVVLTE